MKSDKKPKEQVLNPPSESGPAQSLDLTDGQPPPADQKTPQQALPVPRAPNQKGPEQKQAHKRLPFMLTWEDAEALVEREKDPFYLAAFTVQNWLGGLPRRAAAEYAEKKHPKDRSLQKGEAWKAFQELFEPVLKKGHQYLFLCLIRFSLTEDSPHNTLRRALVPLMVEKDQGGDYVDFKALKATQVPTLDDELVRRTLVRWCDWLDATVHSRTHRLWHTAPAMFEADPETRYLAGLGDAQRYLASLDPRAKMAWLCDFGFAAEHFRDSPKWATVGKAMSAEGDRLWLYPDVDTVVIGLWPLVKLHNWTYRDLLNTIRPALKRPNDYPCGREQDFATYCANVLGLCKNGKGVSAKNGRPVGYEVARTLCPAVQNQKTEQTARH